MACWFRHDKTDNQVFRKDLATPAPPDQMDQLVTMVNTLCVQMGKVEKKLGVTLE